MDRRLDPRSIVTPYAFSVHPDLLGRPLANPWQRLGAILVDLVVIGLIYLFLTLSGLGGLVLGLFTSLFLFWLAFRKPRRDALGRVFRFAVGCLGMFALLVTVIIVVAIRFEGPIEEALQALEEGGVNANLEISREGLAPESEAFVEGLDMTESLTAVREFLTLSRAENAFEASESMRSLVELGRKGGFSTEEIRTALLSMIPSSAPWAGRGEELVQAALEAVALPSDAEEVVPVESPEEGVPPEVPAWLSTPEAADSVEALENLIQRLEQDAQDTREALADTRETLEATEDRLEEAENRSLLDWVRSLLDDLGVGAGWAALYMTLIHVWGKGASIGKRLFGIRVVMIDKRPLSWWLSFERAGGYAAGFATGMLGFAQVFWDPNRQAIHDKVSETIVIRDNKDPIPGPWMAEGAAQWERTRAKASNSSGI